MSNTRGAPREKKLHIRIKQTSRKTPHFSSEITNRKEHRSWELMGIYEKMSSLCSGWKSGWLQTSIALHYSMQIHKRTPSYEDRIQTLSLPTNIQHIKPLQVLNHLTDSYFIKCNYYNLQSVLYIHGGRYKERKCFFLYQVLHEPLSQPSLCFIQSSFPHPFICPYCASELPTWGKWLNLQVHHLSQRPTSKITPPGSHPSF